MATFFAGLFFIGLIGFIFGIILFYIGLITQKTNEIEMFFSLSLPLLLSCFRMVACPSTKMWRLSIASLRN